VVITYRNDAVTTVIGKFWTFLTKLCSYVAIPIMVDHTYLEGTLGLCLPNEKMDLEMIITNGNVFLCLNTMP